MKGKEREKLRGMGANELQAELAKARNEQGKLRFQNAAAPVKNPLELRTLRRRIAALETYLHQKQAKKG